MDAKTQFEKKKEKYCSMKAKFGKHDFMINHYEKVHYKILNYMN